MSVLEVEENCGNFEVIASDYEDPEDDDNDNDIVIVGVDVARHHQSLHMVKPDQQWCTCGAWQDCMFPCRHGIAVYRLHKGTDLTYVTSELVHEYHKFGYVKQTFKQNIYPVSMDCLKSDGITRPPIVKKREAGRPKTKRIRNRSEYHLGDDSPIICSNCRRRGHNKRTCPNPKFTPTECVTDNNDLVEFVLCSHCGEEGHLEWQCRGYTSSEETTRLRNDNQETTSRARNDDHDGGKFGEEPEVDNEDLLFSTNEDQHDKENDLFRADEEDEHDTDDDLFSADEDEDDEEKEKEDNIRNL
jgi:SWIM zinc finger